MIYNNSYHITIIRSSTLKLNVLEKLTHAHRNVSRELVRCAGVTGSGHIVDAAAAERPDSMLTDRPLPRRRSTKQSGEQPAILQLSRSASRVAPAHQSADRDYVSSELIEP